MSGISLLDVSSVVNKMDKTAEKERFLIISTARSGSNQLVDYINQTKAALCFGELFKRTFFEGAGSVQAQKLIVECFSGADEARRIHASDVGKFWDIICSRIRASNRYVGAKLFYEHREHDPFWREVFSSNPIIIHLWRANILESFLSLVRAETTAVWTVRKFEESNDRSPRLTFDEKRYLQYRDLSRRRFAGMCARKDETAHYYDIEYAEIFDSGLIGSVLNNIFDVNVTYSASLLKQAPNDLLENVENRSIAEKYLSDRLDQ